MNSYHFHPEEDERHFAKLYLRANKEAITGAPEKVDGLILNILKMVAQGKDFDITSIEDDCTTQEAANILGVSRTFLVNLLKSGKIPYYNVGRQRRLLKKDVLKYNDERRKKTRKDFDEMISENQEMGFYD